MPKELEVVNLMAKREKLREMLDSLPTTSNFREDLILYFKKWIIVDYALKFNFKKVLFGTTGHKVAT